MRRTVGVASVEDDLGEIGDPLEVLTAMWRKQQHAVSCGDGRFGAALR